MRGEQFTGIRMTSAPSRPAPPTAPLGWIELGGFLERTGGRVVGQVLTDAKVRRYEAEYLSRSVSNDVIRVSLRNGRGDTLETPKRIPIGRAVVAFFGLYSGDGSKGSEDPSNLGRITGSISFSQSEPNLVLFAVRQFRGLFGNQIRFSFSLGEDSAYFMAGTGLQDLMREYGGGLPQSRPLAEVRPELNEADHRYLQESRNVEWSNEKCLAFYYQHKEAMQKILTGQKSAELAAAGVSLGPGDKVEASLRRPFKKGAREPGGSSRADELRVGGLSGFLELFLKIMHEIEASIVSDSQDSPQGLVHWEGRPSAIGEAVSLNEFFSANSFGAIAGERPELGEAGAFLSGTWPRSREQALRPTLTLGPLFSYASGLYLAEGASPKSELFRMYSSRPKGFALEFTSSEDLSLRIMLEALRQVFPPDDVLAAWKIKVGSQYFPELVQLGMKHGVPMLRGGASGDGKLRTMEISLALKAWALTVCPSLVPFAGRYSHVEPTGAGVARVHFWTSSALCRWFFPLMMYTVFGEEGRPPESLFSHD